MNNAGRCIEEGEYALSRLQLTRAPGGLVIYLLFQGESIGLALSRCSGNVCGMKDVSDVCLVHREFTQGSMQS